MFRQRDFRFLPLVAKGCTTSQKKKDLLSNVKFDQSEHCANLFLVPSKSRKKNPNECLFKPGSGSLNVAVACCQFGPQNIWLLQLRGPKKLVVKAATWRLWGGGSLAAH